MIRATHRKLMPRLPLAGLALGCTIIVALTVWSQEAPAPSATEEILRHVQRLASAEFTGRGVDTPGIKLARDYIVGEFAKDGLRPGGDNSGYLQEFDVAVGVEIKQPSSLTLGSNLELVLNDDWTPLGLSANGAADAPLVFAGYGISAKDQGYDDYDGVDVKGKVVLVLRYEPPPRDSKSPFRKAPNYSSHATLRSKANNAREHGALAMILVDVNQGDDEKNQLVSTRGSLARGGESLIAVQVKARTVEKFLDGHGIKLKALKEKIDREGKPASMALPRASARIQVTLQEIRERAENVIGVLPGADPAVADQNIVIGAHYDHLGFGHFGAVNPSTAGQIHHGADDNASGTAVLLDLARRLSRLPAKPARTIIFVAFSAEELGLFGSRHFVERLTSIAATKAMVNLDMVGRLRDNRLTVFGARSGANLSDLIAASAANLGLEIRQSDDVGRSDHMSFYNKKIPALHFSTGMHEDYHRPSDTFEKLNIDGMARISDLALLVLMNLADAKQPVNFVSLPSRPPSEHSEERSTIRVYLGTTPDYGADSQGVRLAGVADDSPAARAGLRAGDVIIKLAGAKIQNIDDLTGALSSRKPGDEVEIVILRMNQPLSLTATLRSRG
jgi:peptidase M28-like protein/PDZ domain-containing protein/PA domain-containing protein